MKQTPPIPFSWQRSAIYKQRQAAWEKEQEYIRYMMEVEWIVAKLIPKSQMTASDMNRHVRKHVMEQMPIMNQARL